MNNRVDHTEQRALQYGNHALEVEAPPRDCAAVVPPSMSKVDCPALGCCGAEEAPLSLLKEEFKSIRTKCLNNNNNNNTQSINNHILYMKYYIDVELTCCVAPD